jgi:hypothetical protein
VKSRGESVSQQVERRAIGYKVLRSYRRRRRSKLGLLGQYDRHLRLLRERCRCREK